MISVYLYVISSSDLNPLERTEGLAEGGATSITLNKRFSGLEFLALNPKVSKSSSLIFLKIFQTDFPERRSLPSPSIVEFLIMATKKSPSFRMIGCLHPHPILSPFAFVLPHIDLFFSSSHASSNDLMFFGIFPFKFEQ
ncbi:hypothetical protein A0H76_404 [Hepatospora eriocheir]|uniref:Uncharacterized protein n=1 Tax=Hepatospora eriocheir TaxID=1081669 RepID=A0A1X0QAQ8_9MICR|nr:hypothetical protein A0H76_404 [Hepatospora eriocheir]